MGAMNAIRTNQIQDVDIRDVDIDNLVDIRNVHINPEHPKVERIFRYIQQMRNPYCFRVDDVAVKVSFAETDKTLEDILVSLLQRN